MTGARKDPRAVLREAGLSPKRSFGQCFLVAEPAARAIAQACVPDDETGEIVVAYVVRKDPALTADALRQHCEQSLTK